VYTKLHVQSDYLQFSSSKWCANVRCAWSRPV